MPTFAIDFVQAVDPSGYTIKDNRIVRCGQDAREMRPLEFHQTLYAQFARLDDEPESFLSFINTFGPLTEAGNYDGENINLLQQMRARMAEIITAAEDDPIALCQSSTWESPGIIEARSKQAGTIEIVVRPDEEFTVPSPFATDTPSEWFKLFSWTAHLQARLRLGPPDGRPTLFLAPDNLWEALKLQLYQAVASGSQIKACEWCGQWFEIGPGGKRAGARYCSDICRLHRHRKGKKQ